MASIDDLDEVRRRELLRWAVVEHYRTWLSFDGIQIQRIAANGNVLDRAAVRRIASEYSVNRGILSTKDENGEKVAGRDDSADWIASRLNEEAAAWPPQLNERAARCAEVANCASKGRTRGKQASAMTKLMWPLKPNGWTVFDELAANGLGIPKKKAIVRMPLFFKALSDRNFNDDAGAINEVLNANGFGPLFGERVIDKFLMLCGADDDWTNEIIATCEAFLSLLPEETRDNLNTAARQISETLADNLLQA